MNSEIDDVRNKVTKFYSGNLFEDGDFLLEEKRKILPEYIILECKGNRLFYERKFQCAISIYAESIKMGNGHNISRYQYLAGTQLEKKGDYVGAFKRYQESIELESDFVDAYVELGGLLSKIGDYEGALKCYRDAYALDSKDNRNLVNLRNALRKIVSDGNSSYLLQLEEIEKYAVNVEFDKQGYQW